jgi:exonuclease VII large subunit
MTDLQLKQPREGDRVAYKSDIDGLREYVAWSERRLDEEIDGLAHRLDEKVDNVATRLDQKIDNVATRLDQKIDHVANQLDTKIGALDQKLDLRFDSLAKQIQIFSWVGGGIATIMASAILLLISRSL